MSEVVESSHVGGVDTSSFRLAGFLAIALSLIGMALRVPKGWWPLSPLVYAAVLVGLAKVPAAGLRALASVGLIFVSGCVGLVSLFMAGITGMFVDESPSAFAGAAYVALSVLYSLVVFVLLVVALRATFRQGDAVEGRVRRLHLILAAIAIVLFQATWVVELYEG